MSCVNLIILLMDWRHLALDGAQWLDPLNIFFFTPLLYHQPITDYKYTS